MADQPASTLTSPLLYSLALTPATRLPAADTLNTAEQARLSGIRHPERRREYVASRLLIRQALAHASEQIGVTAPDLSRLPASGPPTPTHGLQLGLSHTAGHILCAVHDSPVGVDVECRHRQPAWRSLARRWFSDVEQKWLDARNSSEAFLTLWTLKEAWIKANRLGIADNLQSIQLNADTGEKLELIADTQGRAWYAATACQQGLRMALFWEHKGAPQTLTCRQLVGDPATAFAPRAQAWDPVTLINNDRRQS